VRLDWLPALARAQAEAMEQDPSVFLFGEDLRANVFGTSPGLAARFGDMRVRDIPLSEAGAVGLAVGAAMTGLRPILDLTISSFLYCAADQLISHLAKARFVHGGQYALPVVVRTACFYSGSNGAQHSDRPYPMFAGVPGLKIVVPSNALDAYLLLKASIDEDNPVLFFEDVTLRGVRGRVEVTDEDLASRAHLGEAKVVEAGDDVLVIAIGGGVAIGRQVRELLAAEQVSVEVLDLRTVSPLDRDLICSEAARIGRVVVVDPAHEQCSVASEVAALLVDEIFDSLQAPVRRVCTPNIHPPFNRALERQLYPSRDGVLRAARSVLGSRPDREP
jgi:acetoin:2,6-dichlorophenolindophenol oxidoreductase subunit beta